MAISAEMQSEFLDLRRRALRHIQESSKMSLKKTMRVGLQDPRTRQSLGLSLDADGYWYVDAEESVFLVSTPLEKILAVCVGVNQAEGPAIYEALIRSLQAIAQYPSGKEYDETLH